MKRLFGMIATIAAGLLIVVGAVGLLRDTGLFTSPPEAVAEGFVRQLVAGRYDRAMTYLDESMRKELDHDDLKTFAVFIMMRSGEVVDVKGERAWVKGSTAEAHAKLMTTVSGAWDLNLRMVRRSGTWTIAGIGDMEQSQVEGGTESIFGTRIPPPIAMHQSGLEAAGGI
jgi:hypothetical protein